MPLLFVSGLPFTMVNYKVSTQLVTANLTKDSDLKRKEKKRKSKETVGLCAQENYLI